ncbi:MAG: hypothetical protein RCG15_01245 [Candidatus Rickettsia vulgarisii]
MKYSAIKNSFTIIIVACLFLCASCSLKPVYSSKYNTQKLSKLNSIEVEKINSVEGAELLYHLSSILPRDKSVDTKYLLKIKLSGNSLPSIIQKNSDVLWERINQDVQYRLIDIKTNKEVTSGRFSHINSYNIDFLVYNSYVAREKATEDLTKRVAEEIFARLVIYFSSVNNDKN